MKEANLFFLPNNLKKEVATASEKKKLARLDKIDPLFVEKSAQEFTNSILQGNLYREMLPKDKKSQSNLTQI